MSARERVERAKEQEAKLLVEWDRRIKRDTADGYDMTDMVTAKTKYESDILYREQRYQTVVDKMTKVAKENDSDPEKLEDPDKLEFAVEKAGISYESTIWEGIETNTEIINPSRKSPHSLDKEMIPHPAKVRAGAMKDQANADHNGLVALKLEGYKANKAKHEQEAKEAQEGPGLGPLSATVADSSASIGADAKMRSLAGTPTLVAGESLPEMGAVVKTLGHVAPDDPDTWTKEQKEAFEVATRPLTPEQRAQAEEDKLKPPGSGTGGPKK